MERLLFVEQEEEGEEEGEEEEEAMTGGGKFLGGEHNFRPV